MDDSTGWGYVIIGTVLVGLGGALATRGWNNIRSAEQWNNSLESLQREFDLNRQLIDEAKSVIDRWPSRSQGDNISYERFHSAQLNAVITAGKLSQQNPRDAAIYKALVDYQRSVARFNAGLEIVGRHNPGMYIRVDLIDIDDKAKWPTSMDETLCEGFKNLIARHDEANGALHQMIEEVNHR